VVNALNFSCDRSLVGRTLACRWGKSQNCIRTTTTTTTEGVTWPPLRRRLIQNSPFFLFYLSMECRLPLNLIQEDDFHCTPCRNAWVYVWKNPIMLKFSFELWNLQKKKKKFKTRKRKSFQYQPPPHQRHEFRYTRLSSILHIPTYEYCVIMQEWTEKRYGRKIKIPSYQRCIHDAQAMMLTEIQRQVKRSINSAPPNPLQNSCLWNAISRRLIMR
jgi:hypothetical protein